VNATTAHDDWLEVAAETGVPGLLLLAAAVIGGAAACLRDGARAEAATLVAFAVSALGDSPLRQPAVLVPVALVLASAPRTLSFMKISGSSAQLVPSGSLSSAGAEERVGVRRRRDEKAGRRLRARFDGPPSNGEANQKGNARAAGPPLPKYPTLKPKRCEPQLGATTAKPTSPFASSRRSSPSSASPVWRVSSGRHAPYAAPSSRPQRRSTKAPNSARDRPSPNYADYWQANTGRGGPASSARRGFMERRRCGATHLQAGGLIPPLERIS